MGCPDGWDRWVGPAGGRPPVAWGVRWTYGSSSSGCCVFQSSTKGQKLSPLYSIKGKEPVSQGLAGGVAQVSVGPAENREGTVGTRVAVYPQVPSSVIQEVKFPLEMGMRHAPAGAARREESIAVEFLKIGLV